MPEPPAPPPSPGTPFQESIPRQALGLAAWIGLWLLLEARFRHLGLNDRQQLAAFLAILATAGALAALAARAWLFRLLTSVRFAVTQGLFLLGSALLGALPRPGPAPFRSLWGCALLALLAVSMLAVSWKRRPYTLARLGFLLVHGAPSLVLLGVLWGRFDGVRASARLTPGVTVERLAGGGPEVLLPGFGLRLEAPARPPDPRLYAFIPAGADPAGAAGVREVPPGAPTALPGGFQAEQLELIPDAVETGQVMENPSALGEPALRVVLGLGLPSPLVGHLFARGGERSRQDAPGGRFAVVFREAWDPALLASLRPAPARAETLELTAQGRTLRHSAQPGEPWQLPGCTLQVTRAYPDFAVRPGPGGEPEAFSRSDSPREPWLQLELADGSGPARRLLLSARDPALSDRLNAPHLPPGTTLRYLREGEETQRRFVLFTRDDRQVRLLEDGRVVRAEPLVLGQPFIVERGLSVTAEALLEHTEPVFAANPNPGSGHPVVRARVSDPRSGRAQVCWLEPGSRDQAPAPVLLLDGQVGLVYRDRLPGPGAPPPELVVLDPAGRELARKAPAAGDPLRFRGYRFAPDAGAPWGDRIQVVREPGLGLIAAGCACFLLGCAWMFYLKPVLKRREARP